MIEKEAVAAFVAAFHPGVEFGNYQAIGFTRDGVLEAGVIYHEWEPEGGTLEMSLGAVNRRWLTRERLRQMFGYPFGIPECRMVYGKTRHPVVLRACQAMGGTVCPVRGLPSVVTLTREEWTSHEIAQGSGRP